MKILAVVTLLLLGTTGAVLAQGIAGIAVGPDENTYILWDNTNTQGGVSVRVESINSFNGTVVQQGTFSQYFTGWQIGGFNSNPPVGFKSTLAVGPNDDVQVGAISPTNNWLSIWHFTQGTYNGATTFGAFNPVPNSLQTLFGVAIDDSDTLEFLTTVADPNQQFYYESTQQSYVATTGAPVAHSTLDKEIRGIGTAITNSGLEMMLTCTGGFLSPPYELNYPSEFLGNWIYAGAFYSANMLPNPLLHGNWVGAFAVSTTSNNNTQIYFNGPIGGDSWDLVILNVNPSGGATESPAFAIPDSQPVCAGAYALPLSRIHGNNTDLEVAWYDYATGGYKIETINPSNWSVVGTFTP